MNLFGLEITTSKNGKYIKKASCREMRESISEVLNQRIEDLKDHIDTRFEDMKTLILKNGRG